MKPEKMTDEELARMKARQESRLLSEDESEMWAHISALAAERDALRERVQSLEQETADLRGWLAEARAQREAFCERVQALEAENKRLRLDVQAEAAFKRQHRDEAGRAESRLSAILQRVGSRGATDRALQRYDKAREWNGHYASLAEAVGAAINYVVGEDATGAERTSGATSGPIALTDPPGCVTPASCSVAEPKCPHHAPPERICEHDVVPCTTCHPPASPEPSNAPPCSCASQWCPFCNPPVASPKPSTAEAFATLRGMTVYHRQECDSRIGPSPCTCGVDAMRAALSLLERRMGVMGWAARPLMALLSALEEAGMPHTSGAPIPDKTTVAQSPLSGGRVTHRITMGTLRRIRAALADAPAVFTLEEVEQVLRREELGPATARRVREALAALRK